MYARSRCDAIRAVAAVAAEIRQSSEGRQLSMEPGPPPSVELLPDGHKLFAAIRRDWGRIQNAYIRPDIPPRKERKARERYGALLAGNERVLLLYDGSTFFSGKNGIILTDRGIGWAPSSGTPNFCVFSPVTATEISNGQWTGLLIDGKPAAVWMHERDAVAAALRNSLRTVCNRF